MTINVAFLLIFLALQVLDIATTLKALKLGGREVNPVLAKLFERFDPLATMVTIKLAGVWALWWLDMYVLTGIMCAVYLYVVDQNLAVVKKLQK
jgi:hypothetical protein